MRDVTTRCLMQSGDTRRAIGGTVFRLGRAIPSGKEKIIMTVVVGVDGSEPSRAALRLAAQEAHCRQVPLVAVSAYEPPLGTPGGGFPVAALHTDDEERATAESELRDAVSEELGDQAGQTDLRVAAGLAGRGILETARPEPAPAIRLAARP